MQSKKQNGLEQDKMGKYLIVPGEAVQKIVWKIERVAGFNDFYNDFTPTGTISASEILKQAEIPEEYHKIVLRNYLLKIFANCDAEEYTTGCRLNITTAYKKDGKKTVGYADPSLFVGDGALPRTLSIYTIADYVDHDEIMNFYTELNEAGLLETYLDTMKKIFVPGSELYVAPREGRIYNEGREKQLIKHYSNLPKNN